MHFVDLYWQVMPTLHPDGLRPSALDVAALVAVGGCFVAAASWLMRRQALVPNARPEARRIARVRERLRSDKSLASRTRVCPVARMASFSSSLREIEFLRRLPALMTGGRAASMVTTEGSLR